MNPYTAEDYKTDVEWLKDCGATTSEIDDLLLVIVKRAFVMTKKEMLKFLREVEE